MNNFQTTNQSRLVHYIS